MISRKSALLIHRFYEELSTEDVGFASRLDTELLWDLLYTNDFEEWFLDLVKATAANPTRLKQLIVELHTGRVVPKSVAVTISGCQIRGRGILYKLALLALIVTGDIGHERVNLGDVGQQLKAQLE